MPIPKHSKELKLKVIQAYFDPRQYRGQQIPLNS